MKLPRMARQYVDSHWKTASDLDLAGGINMILYRQLGRDATPEDVKRYRHKSDRLRPGEKKERSWTGYIAAGLLVAFGISGLVGYESCNLETPVKSVDVEEQNIADAENFR